MSVNLRRYTRTPDPASDPTLQATGLLEVRGLTVTFPLPDRTVYAVNGIDLTVGQGETLAVIGESGSGKTVAARSIMGLLPFNAVVTGSATIGGRELIGIGERELRHRRGRDVAMIFQDPTRSLNPTMRIGKQIAEAVRVHLPHSRAEAKARALELLDMVRLPAARQRYDEFPHQLSGGMRQRIMIAIALACNPALLIADEATTALDVTTQAQIMDLLMDLQAELHMGLLLISHDMGLAATYADQVVVMYAGRVVERASTPELFANVRMPYTRVLLEAVPRLDRAPHTPFPTISGRPPDLTKPGGSCSFAPRCTRAEARCREELPLLEEHGPDGHAYACLFPVSEEDGRD